MADQRLLGGRYRLAQPLGSGGMADVHLGRDTRLGREVAIKLLRKDLASDPTFIARFRREAQSAAALNHPNVVSIYDTGDDKGAPYIVMEYVEGRTLRDALRSDGRMPIARAVEIASTVCAALDYSHAQGIVHRDVKPGNVMLSANGSVKVMDFGIARAITSATATMTQTSAVFGTAAYLSPEQARGEHVDARSDVYSTGCLLYELLTHVPPFTGDSAVSVAYQHVREDPTPPSMLNPDVDESLEAIVLTAMAKNPAQRYQTAGAMRDDLQRAADGFPVRAASADDRTQVIGPTLATTTVIAPVSVGASGPRRTAGYVALGIATLAIFFVALLFVRSFLTGNSGQQVATPDLLGMTVAQADATLGRVGLSLADPTLVFADKPAGTITRQDPIANITLRQGQTVRVEVSKGVELVVVPNLVNKTQAEAQAELADAKLRLGTVTLRDIPGPPGRVLSSNPGAGRQVRAGSAVNIEVRSGKLVMPDVFGKDVGTARAELEKLGFVDIRTVDQPTNNPAEDGTVVDQNPAAGTSTDRNATVTLTVARAVPPTPTPEPTPTDSGFPTPAPPSRRED